MTELPSKAMGTENAADEPLSTLNTPPSESYMQYTVHTCHPRTETENDGKVDYSNITLLHIRSISYLLPGITNTT